MLAPPLPGPVVRSFSYSPARPFLAGAHRGVDIGGAAGAVVRAACSGRVAWASGTVVSLRCGPWRVSLLPLATITVRAGARVHAGERVGTLGHEPDHAGLHLGVRRADDRFGYVDPAPMLAHHPRVTPPALPPAPRPRVLVPAAPRPRVLRPAPRPDAVSGLASHPRALVEAAPPSRALHARVPTSTARARPDAVRVLAPWPAWLGLGVLLVGAGGGVRLRVRARRLAVVSRRLEGAGG